MVVVTTPSYEAPKCLWILDTPAHRSMWYDSALQDLKRLRELMHASYCVSIDVEGQEDSSSGITSVGIAILPPTSVTGSDSFCRRQDGDINLDDLVLQHRIGSHCFAIQGRSRSVGYEKFHYGPVTTVDDSETEGKITAILDAVNCPRTPASIILVGFDMSADMRAISSKFLAVLEYATQWVDIGVLARRLSTRPHLRPSLRDIMLSLGFRRNHSVQTRYSNHSAGMDAVRTLGTLIALVARQPMSQKLVVYPHTQEEHRNRKVWEKVFSPRARFPHTTKISTADASPLPTTLSSPHRLFNLVKATFEEPKAVSVCPPAKQKRPRTHGWICFYDEATLEDFIREWDGKEVDGKILRVGGKPPPEVQGRMGLASTGNKPQRASGAENWDFRGFDMDAMLDSGPLGMLLEQYT